MSQKEFQTIKTLVTSNKYFCNALNSGKNISLDFNIKIELIIYYLTLNQEYLSKISNPSKDLFLSLIENHNYVIETEYLLIEETTVTLEDLINVVKEIERSKTEPSGKVIYFTNSNTNREPKIIRPQKNQIIQFSEAQKNMFYSTLERATIYERTTKIDQVTLPYISRTKHDYIALVNDIVLRGIYDNLEGYNLKYLKVIASYLRLYPFTIYAKNKIDLPYQKLSLPQNEIGLRKATYNNPLTDEIEKKIALLVKRENRLIYEREKFEHDLSIKTIVLTHIEQELITINKEKNSLFFTLYILRNSPELYNETVLTFLTKAFTEGTVEINRFIANPIVKLFYIEDNQTKFHCSMRLNTLFNIFNPNELIEKIDGPKKIRTI